jgi:succinylarginine dihydrolase
MTSHVQELQLDGLVGPTHHFGGLSFGNVASMTHAGWHSRPRQAARQGLAKMRQVLALGLPQAVLPPLERPDLCFLRQTGFCGSDVEVLTKAAGSEPYLLHLAMSSAFMWTANAATVVPSHDSEDGRCHVIVANLTATPHRAIEAQARAVMLRQLFPNPHLVRIHDPLPSSPALSDEGAANHCRLAPEHAAGWHLFVYGRAHDTPVSELPCRFPARQSHEASRAVARLGKLQQGRGFFARQQAGAIDAGAFHNDVLMVTDGDRLLVHEQCLVEQQTVLEKLRQHLPTLQIYEVKQRDLSLPQAVKSYLFNSQLLHTLEGRILLAPVQSSSGPAAAITQRLVDDDFIDRVMFQNLDQSMAGGGGPACLRLRLPLTREELASMTPGVLLDNATLTQLETWVDQHYRDELTPADLADPQLLTEARQALETLTQILGLGSIYAFQRLSS